MVAAALRWFKILFRQALWRWSLSAKASAKLIWDGILSAAVAARKFLAQLKFKQLEFYSYRQEAKAAKSLSLGLLGLGILLLYEIRKVGNEVFDYFGACICGVRAREQYAKMGERDYRGRADPAG